MNKLSAARKEAILEKLAGLPGWATKKLSPRMLRHLRKGDDYPVLFHGPKELTSGAGRQAVKKQARGREAAIFKAKAKKAKDPRERESLLSAAEESAKAGRSAGNRWREIRSNVRPIEGSLV